MAAQPVVYFADVKAGTLWKTAKGPPSLAVASYAADAGLHPLLSVIDAKSADAKDVSRAVKIACVAFRPHEVAFDDDEAEPVPNLALVDQRGHVYVFDIEHDSFDLVARTGISGSAIALGSFRPWELFVAFSDQKLFCYNIETMKTSAKLPHHHRSIVRHISVHPSAPRILTTADTEAVLWDSEGWIKLQVLTGSEGSSVNQTGFSPGGELIVAAFNDNSLVVWETFGLDQLWRLDANSISKGLTPAGINCWAVSADSTLIATGGWKSVQVWDLASNRLYREMSDRMLHDGVAAVSFIGQTQTLVVQNKSGDLLFMNAETGSVKFITNLYPVKSFSVSADGRLVVVHPGSAPTAVTIWSVDELMAFDYTPPVNAPRPGTMTPERSPSVSSRRSESGGGSGTRLPRRTTSGTFARSPERLSGSKRDLPSSAQSVSNRRSYHALPNSTESHLDASTKRRSMTFNSKPERRQSGASSPTVLTPRHRRRQSMKLEQPGTSTTTRGGQLLDERPRSRTLNHPDNSGHQRSFSHLSSGSSFVSGFDNTQSSLGSMLNAGLMLTNADLADLKEAEASTIYEILERFIRKRGGFPDEYRSVIWRFLLRLPDNQAAYRAIVSRGEHACIQGLRSRFLLRDKKIQFAMESTMSALAHWSPKFADLAYLPFLCFPFVKLFQEDLFACFEIVVTILVNWCQDWWDTYPNPPAHVLRAIEALLHHHDPELFRHLQLFGVDASIYGWIPLQSFFSECLPRQHWSRLWDNSFSRQPRFLYHFSIAFLIALRGELFMLDAREDFVEFFHKQQQELDMKRALKLAAKLNTGSYGSESDVFGYFRPFRPIPRAGESGDILSSINGEAAYPSLESLIAREEMEGEGEAHPGSFGEMDELMQQRLAALRLE